MESDNPLVLAGMIAAAAVTARWWWADLSAARQGRPATRPFPGATPASPQLLVLACAGALLLLTLETAGEYALDLQEKQSHMTVLFAFYSLAAAFIEELIFRGYLVVENHGRAGLLAGILGASLLFAMLHPFLWEWRETGLLIHTDPKGWFSTAMIFAGSLWFYTLRFLPINRTHSLLPCIVAHATKNLGVIAIKSAQGFLGGWW